MPNYGNYPYEEAAAKGQARMSLLQRIGQAFAGAGYGIAASQGAQNPLEALGLGFAGSYGKVNAARQAAEEYARKKIEAQQAQEARQIDQAYKMALTERAKRPEPPQKPEKQVDPELDRLNKELLQARIDATKAGAAARGRSNQPKPPRVSQSKTDKLNRERFALQNADDPTELLKVSNDGTLEPETRQRAWAKYRRLISASNPSQVR